jgi:hypothetical protein
MMKGTTMKKLTICLATLLCASVALAQEAKKSILSDESEKAVQAAAKVIEKWGKDPVLIREVTAQNNKKMTQAEIDTIDKAWMDGGEQARSNELLGNACATHLKALVAAQKGFSESFVMDDKGANVCMTNRTSDFWQGDEAKWQKSFAGGKGALFVDQPKYDTSAKAILVQISVPVMDGGRAIGAITVGVNTNQIAAK